MPISVAYQFDEVSTSESLLDRNSRAVLKAFVYGTPGVDNEFTAREGLKLLAPEMYGSLIKDTVSILRRVVDNGTDLAWEGEVGYAHQDQKEQPKPTDETTTVLEIRSGGGGTTQRTFSRDLIEEQANLDAYKFTGTDAERILGLKAADADNGVSLQAQGIPFKQSGTQIIIYVWRSNATVNNGFLLDVTDACDRQVVNSLLFKGFPVGSLQFVDFSAVQKAGTNPGWDFTFTLSYAKSVAVEIPGLPAFTATKKGHQYLDVLFMPKLIPVKNVVMSQAVRAAIHDIFEGEDFNNLFKI